MYIPKPVGLEKVTEIGRFEYVEQQMQVDEKGKLKHFQFIRRAPGVRIIFVDGDKMLITREARAEYGGYDYRLPGGKVFDTLQEYKEARQNGSMITYAESAAKREALEETGLVIDEIEHYYMSPLSTSIVLDLHYFIAKKWHESKTGQQLEDGEHIQTEWRSLEDVKRMCLDGSIKEDRTVAVLLKYLLSRH